MTAKLKAPKGSQAARLRQRKHAVLAALTLPSDALPGSLALTHRRCGHPTCHCAQGEGHPLWSLTFMVQGKKRVEWIPAEWVADVQRRVAAGRAFKEAVTEVLTANALLLVLDRHQRRA
jgi:Family of unknown function (DUF6788)